MTPTIYLFHHRCHQLFLGNQQHPIAKRPRLLITSWIIIAIKVKEECVFHNLLANHFITSI